MTHNTDTDTLCSMNLVEKVNAEISDAETLNHVGFRAGTGHESRGTNHGCGVRLPAGRQGMRLPRQCSPLSEAEGLIKAGIGG